MVKSIKEVRQKNQNGNYNASIPIGTDGSLVDMFSGLSLEEELKIGENHTTTVTDIDDGSTLISQTFDGFGKTSDQKKQFTLDTTISTDGNTITQVLTEYVFAPQQPGTQIVKAQVQKTIKISESGKITSIVENLTSRNYSATA